MIHSHAIYATMFAVAQQPIPSCIDEFTVYLGGEVRCTEYAVSGSDELGEQTVKALQGRGAALIANHGMVAVAPTMAKAMHNTALVERIGQDHLGRPPARPHPPSPRKGRSRLPQRVRVPAHPVMAGGRMPARMLPARTL